MNKIRKILCEAHPLTIVLNTITIVGSLILCVWLGPKEFLIAYATALVVLGVAFGFGYLLHKVVVQAQAKCKENTWTS